MISDILHNGVPNRLLGGLNQSSQEGWTTTLASNTSSPKEPERTIKRTLMSSSTRGIEDVPVRPAEPSIEEHAAEASEDSLKFLTSKGLQDYNDLLKNWLPTEYVRKDDPSGSCEVNIIKGGTPIKMRYVFKYAFFDQDIKATINIVGEFGIDGIRVDSFEVEDYPEGWSNFSISPMHEMSDSFELSADYQGTTYQMITRGAPIAGTLIFSDQVIGSYQCSMICGALDSDLDLTKHNIVNVPFLSEDGDISYSFSEFQAFEYLQGSVISSTLTDVVFQMLYENTGIKAILFAGEGEIIEQATGMEKAYAIMFSYDEEQSSEDISYMKSITYDELKGLRDSGELVPGMQYRITDYECTTVMGSTQSANHQFDIIVTADSESVLNENARAINHYEEPAQVPGLNIRIQIDNNVKIEYSNSDGKYYGIVTGNEIELYGTTYYRVNLSTSGTKDFTLASEETQPSVVYINTGSGISRWYGVNGITRNLLYTSYENNSGSSIQFILNGTETLDETTYYKFTNNEQLVLKQLKKFDKITGEPSYVSNSAGPGNLTLYALSDTPSDFSELYMQMDGTIMRLIDALNAEYRSGFFSITTECTPTTIEVPYDDYFKDSNLKSWEIKYSLDNDTNRFDWALDGIQPAPSLTAFLFWEDDEGQEYVYTHYEVNAEYIEWWEEVLDSAEEVELDLGPRRGVRASSPHVFTGVKGEYDSGVYGASDLKNKVGKIKEMKVEEQPTKAFLTWWYLDEGKQQYVTFYECKIDEKAGLIHWFNGDSPVYKECYTYRNPLVWSSKASPEALVYSDKSFKTSIGYISQYSLPSAKKGTLNWKDSDTDRTYNSYYVYNNESNKQVVAWTGEDISEKQEDNYGPNTVYTYCPPSDYSEADPQESGYVYSSDSLDDRTRLRGPADIGTINDFNMPVIPAEETRGVLLRETVESEPTYITGKGLIYYMKDEYGNEAPYDFKNIQYVIGEKVLYTFNIWKDELQSYNDDSTVGYGTCYGNVIKTYKSTENKQALNFIIHGSKCTLNTFEGNCHSNNIGDSCHSNTFKENCSKNSIESKCAFNTFEKGFVNNKISMGTTYVHAFEYVINCNIGGKYIQVYPYTHDIAFNEQNDYPKFVGNPVQGKDAQIAEYWPYRIKYSTTDIYENKPFIYPVNATNYQCNSSLIGLAIYYDSSNNMNFKVEFTADADFTISLPSNSRYIGSLECERGKHYLLTHDDEGMYYIGELNTSI